VGIFGRILLLFSSGGPHWVKSYGLKPGKTKGHVVVLAFPNGQEVTLSYDPKTIKTSIGSGREALPMLAFLRGSFMCSGMATLQSVACRHRQQLLGFVERDSGTLVHMFPVLWKAGINVQAPSKRGSNRAL